MKVLKERVGREQVLDHLPAEDDVKALTGQPCGQAFLVQIDRDVVLERDPRLRTEVATLVHVARLEVLRKNCLLAAPNVKDTKWATSFRRPISPELGNKYAQPRDERRLRGVDAFQKRPRVTHVCAALAQALRRLWRLVARPSLRRLQRQPDRPRQS